MELTQKQQDTLLKAKILLFDLEVSPMLVYTYNYYDANVLKIVEHQKLLCFSYKWLGEKEPPRTVISNGKDDSLAAEKLWWLLDEANYAVGHNASRFDAKMANVFFVEHGLKPTTPYKVIDTLTTARQKFKFPSNKLDELGKFLGVGQKTQITHADLWESCLDGDKEAFKKMADYCEQDVVLLEQVYWKLMPFAQAPMFNKIVNADLVCPICGGKEFTKINKYVPDATVQPSWTYKCNCCSHMVKVPLSKLEREELGFEKPVNRNIAGCF